MTEFSVYDFFNLLNERKVEIRMDAGQVDVPPHPEILRVLREEIGELGYTSYQGIRELREFIAEIHGVDLEEVIVVPGSKFATAALIHAAKHVGLIAPHWPGYSYAVKVFGKKTSTIHARMENGWLPDFCALNDDVDTLIINYPNNPTGAVLTRDKVRELLDLASERRLTVLSDEVYRDLVYEGDAFTILDYNLERAASIYSFSKTFSLPGLRLGYVVGDRSLIRYIGEFIKATYTSAPIFAQKAAVKALELRDEISERVRRIYRERVEAFTKAIDRSKFDFVKPSGGLYVFLKIRSGISSLKLAYKLAERGVGIFPGIAFGEAYDSYIRVSLTCPVPLVERGARILNEAVEQC